MSGEKPKFWLVGNDADHARLNGMRTWFSGWLHNFGFIIVRKYGR